MGTASSELVDVGQQALLQHLLSLPPGEKHSELLQLRRVDGSSLAVLATISTLETPQGLRRCLIVADPTAMHRAEQALVDSELSYRMLAMNAQDGILILEWGSGQITMANPHIGQLLVLAPEELLGKQL